MDQLKSALDLARHFLPPDLWNKAVLALGYLALFGQIVPLLLSWGVPAAGRAADAVARFFLATPLRPLIVYFLPYIVKFLDALVAALEQIAETFKAKLEEDLQAAAKEDAAKKADAPPSAAAAPTPTETPAPPAAPPLASPNPDAKNVMPGI